LKDGYYFPSTDYDDDYNYLDDKFRYEKEEDNTTSTKKNYY
jgi:hypothetical protein